MSPIHNINRKSLKLALLCLLAPLFPFAQTLTGLWIGSLSNDSNSVRKDQSYEIALTEYRGKVYGYSRNEFIVNDTLYYIVKRVKGTITGDVCEVKDAEILAYNFPTRLDKGVKVSNFFYRNKVDSTWYLAGKWKTNSTKKYYSVTGKVDLKEEKDLSASKLFPHLQELNLLDDVAFYKERTKTPEPVVMKLVEPDNKQTMTDEPVVTKKLSEPIPVELKSKPKLNSQESTKSADPKALAINKEPAKATKQEIIPEEKKEPTVISKPNVTSQETVSATSNLVKENITPPDNTASTKTVSQPVTQEPKTVPIVKQDKKEVALEKVQQKIPEKQVATIPKTNNPPQKESLTASPNPDNKSTAPIKIVSTNNTPPQKQAVTTGVTTSQPVVTTIPAVETKKELKPVVNQESKELTTLMGTRKSEFSQMVSFKSDSLELALYDNGEIDGDTVSIFMNGEVLMARQGLKATAIKKTIYLTPGKDDEFTLVLFADNLGKYPPNTGLLVVHDGEDVYNLRFSADFQKNAGVVFRRKK